MSEDDRYALLVPWYVNGTLAPDETAEIEEHLSACSSCRDLVGLARRQAELRELDPDAMEHPHASLLVQYVDSPERLDAETTEWIEGRLAACASCRDAIDRLRETRPGEESPRWYEKLWQGLAATALRPVPAAAYLLLLFVGAGFLLTRGPLEGDGTLMTAPLRISLSGDRDVRAGQAPQQRIAMRIPGSAGTVLLELETELSVVDLQAGDLAFVLELRRDGELEWSEPRDAEGFVVRDRRVALPVLIHPRRLDANTVYQIALRIHKPGDPLDGQALFKRSIQIDAGSTGSAP